MAGLDNEAHYMRLALAEAKKADPFPNPQVGAVIVKNRRIIATGHHEYSGGPHAELAAIRKAGRTAKGATLYVTLEPCSHIRKKTPPCTIAIKKAGISRVVYGTLDRNPSVHGHKFLKDFGIEASGGVLAKDCEKLNARIFSHFQKRMPLVAVRYAMSLDGKIAARTGDSKWISNEKARNHARRLRGSYDVLLAGANTVLADNPLLTCRTPGMPEPLRIICDSHLRVKPGMRVFRDQNIMIATSMKRNLKRQKELEAAGIDIIICGKERVDLKQLLRAFFEMGKRSVLIEGGGELIGSAFDLHLVDRIYTYIAPKIIGGEDAISPVRGKGIALVRNALKLSNPQIMRFG
ncbi:MAG: bifunctional diaminohydroxyphosphoribosylaminopyrimidine deaminase/5-amino-6-(5-phosphoribosylamino)uracil reductase RibD, partial [Candidatus Micrarchaeia archaeon]